MSRTSQFLRILKGPLQLPLVAKVWLGTVIAVLGFSACHSVNRTVLTVPKIPGAEFVGSEDCMLCHDKIGREFFDTAHAKLMVSGDTGLNMGCETCHGPGSLHSEEGEGRHLIHNPKRNPQTCFQCHLEVQGQFALQHSHPLGEGKTTCIDCHNPHGDAMGNATETFAHGPANSQGCVNCHPSQSGPFVFEHEAMAEGCEACHDPHGSVNPKMLKIRNSNLCMQCHFTEVRSNAIMIGGVDHTGFGYLQQGSCWTAGCHEAVHGSHVNGSLRF